MVRQAHHERFMVRQGHYERLKVYFAIVLGFPDTKAWLGPAG